MNTGKQVNIMVLILFVSVIALGAYTLWEPFRAESSEDIQREKNVERGAYLFAQYCRSCHGDKGEGGGVSNRLPAALPLNRFDLQGRDEPDAPVDEALLEQARALVINTITCGRVGTAMPSWGKTPGYSGPLTDVQIEQLADLITYGEWGLAKLEAIHADEAAGATPGPVVQTSTTPNGRCGQVAVAVAPSGTPTPAGPTPTPAAEVVEVTIVSKNTLYDIDEIKVKAGAQVKLTHDNQDPGVSHNWALYESEDAANAGETPLTSTPLVVGLATQELTFAAPATPGTYFFRCDVHLATMYGDFIVE